MYYFIKSKNVPICILFKIENSDNELYNKENVFFGAYFLSFIQIRRNIET